VWGHVTAADPLWLSMSGLAVTLTFPLRAIRWRVLLEHAAGGAPAFRPVWHATAIGFMANNILPARAGEVVRSFAANRLVRVPFSTALASVAVERVFDGVVIGLMLAAAIAAPGFPAGAKLGSTNLAALAVTMTLGFIGALVFLLALVRARSRVLPAVDRVLRRMLPERIAGFAARVTHHLADGVGVLHSVRDVGRVLWWSFMVWSVNAVSFLLGYLAFDFRELPLSSALLLQGVVALGVAIPQAPGFFGGFELLTRASLGLYGLAGDRAVSYGFAIHVAWFVPITLIGLWLLARTGLSLSDLRGKEAAR
jgi:hypothetical protein